MVERNHLSVISPILFTHSIFSYFFGEGIE